MNNLHLDSVRVMGEVLNLLTKLKVITVRSMSWTNCNWLSMTNSYPPEHVNIELEIFKENEDG